MKPRWKTAALLAAGAALLIVWYFTGNEELDIELLVMTPELMISWFVAGIAGLVLTGWGLGRLIAAALRRLRGTPLP